jgi:hypothetical protein
MPDQRHCTTRDDCHQKDAWIGCRPIPQSQRNAQERGGSAKSRDQEGQENLVRRMSSKDAIDIPRNGTPSRGFPSFMERRILYRSLAGVVHG